MFYEALVALGVWEHLRNAFDYCTDFRIVGSKLLFSQHFATVSTPVAWWILRFRDFLVVIILHCLDGFEFVFVCF